MDYLDPEEEDMMYADELEMMNELEYENCGNLITHEQFKRIFFLNSRISRKKKKLLFLLFTVPKICSPKDSKRSLNFFSQENIESDGNLNSSSELNGVLPLSQTSVVSFNLDDKNENEVSYFILLQ